MENALRVSVILSATDRMSAAINNAVTRSSKSLRVFATEANALGNSALDIGRQAGFLGLAVGAPLYMMAEAAEESQQATKKLEQVFKSMGETSGRSAAQAKKFSESLMMEIAVDDEKIMAVQTKLATFEKVIKNTAGTSEIFERATRAAFDLEAAGFGDAISNTTQLGKALQDPLKGMQALKKAGTLTQADITRIGKEYSKTGDILKTQRQIMEAVEKQVKGVAKANVTDTAKIKIAFGEVAETLGMALLPAIEKFAKWFTTRAVPAIQKFVDENGPLIKNILMGATALAAISLAVSVFAFLFGGILKVLAFGSTAFATITTAIGLFKNGVAGASVAFKALDAAMKANVIILIASLIAAAAVAIWYNWDKIKAFFIRLWDSVKQVFLKTWNWIKNLFLNYHPLGLIYKHWDKITAWFRNLWEKVKQAFSAFWKWVKDLFMNYHPYGLIIKHWDKIVGFFRDIWTRVKALFMSFVNWVMQLPMRFYKAGEAIVNSIWNGMKAKFNDMKNWFKSGLQDLRDMLPFSPAKRGPLKDIHRLKLVETIATNIKPGPMVDAMNKSLGKVKGAVTPKGGGSMALAGVGGGSGGGSPVTVNFQPTINMGAGAGGSKQDFLRQLKEYEPELMRLIKDATARGERRKF